MVIDKKSINRNNNKATAVVVPTPSSQRLRFQFVDCIFWGAIVLLSF